MLRSLAPPAWLKLPTRTARMRLTLFYAGLFLLLGTMLIGLVYLLARSTTVAVSSATPIRRLNLPPGVPVPPLPAKREIAHLQQNADLARLLTISWVVLAITTIGAAVLGWFVAGRVLRPLRSITSTARTISAGNLHERLALTGPNDEFKQLGDTLDDLLGRLEASFEAQRRFVASASHELRTPLTLERTLLQVALADPTGNEQTLRATCEELLASQADQERLLEALLTLASSERGLEQRRPVDVEALVAAELERLRPKIERSGLTLESTLGPAVTTGEPALIRRLIANLIDNAIDHNVEGGRIEVRTDHGTEYALLTVSNSGPPIEAAQVEKLFEPFQRLNGRTAENGHHGLGLSIVRAIVVAHNAEVAATPRPGGGLTVTVRLPRPAGPGDTADVGG